MSLSFLLLSGLTSITLLSYLYNIKRYFMSVCDVTGNFPIKSVYMQPVVGLMLPNAANTSLILSSCCRNRSVVMSLCYFDLLSIVHCFIFVHWIFFLVQSKCPNVLAVDFGKCFLMAVGLTPGKEWKLLLFVALIQVCGTGLKHAACMNFIRSCCVSGY